MVAATAKPHAEILKVTAEILKEKEITLEIIVCDNYEEPNGMVESGERYLSTPGFTDWVKVNYMSQNARITDFKQQ